MSIPPVNASHGGFVHEAVYFDSSPQLVEATAPLLRRAMAHGEDVALVCTEGNNRAMAEALGDDTRLMLLPRSEIYQKAVTAAAYLRDFVRDRVAAGSQRVWMLGEVDFSVDDRALDEWRRYESLLNHALSPFPLWLMCGYDTRTLPDPVLVTSELTHPYLRRNGLQAPNPAHVDPAELMRLTDADDALVPEVEPDLTLAEVLDFRELHRELNSVLRSAGLAQERVADVVMAVHEVATNGLLHGAPPVSVTVWCNPGRVVCTVSDRGSGYDDPFTGYVRGGGEDLPEGGLGLWLARQLCDEVVTSRTPEGFTARLIVSH